MSSGPSVGDRAFDETSGTVSEWNGSHWVVIETGVDVENSIPLQPVTIAAKRPFPWWIVVVAGFILSRKNQ